MTKTISDAAMVRYWSRRVAELEAMRPITAAEAEAEAARLEAEAAEHERRASDLIPDDLERGRIEKGDSVQSRDRRNAERIGDHRKANWGEATRALQCRGKAEAMRRIAGERDGAALSQSLDEARQRLAYYTALASA